MNKSSSDPCFEKYAKEEEEEEKEAGRCENGENFWIKLKRESEGVEGEDGEKMMKIKHEREKGRRDEKKERDKGNLVQSWDRKS